MPLLSVIIYKHVQLLVAMILKRLTQSLCRFSIAAAKLIVGNIYHLCVKFSMRVAGRHSENAPNFALTTIRVYSMIENGQKRGGVEALLRNSPILQGPSRRCIGSSHT